MHVRFVVRFVHGAWFLSVALLAGCASLRYGAGESPAVITAFADADTLLAHGRYEDAIRAYGEFLTSYPTSAYADDAYLRIAHIYLYRPDSSRGWPGWSGADYAVARDTLLALVRRYPRTDRRVEAENWIKVLDVALRGLDARVQKYDSTTAPVEQRRTGTPTAQLETDRRRLRASLRRAEAERDSLAALNRQLGEENAALTAELARLREETERVRRMLIELERHRAEGQ